MTRKPMSKKASKKKKKKNNNHKKGYVPMTVYLTKSEKKHWKKHCKDNFLKERWEGREAILQRMNEKKGANGDITGQTIYKP